MKVRTQRMGLVLLTSLIVVSGVGVGFAGEDKMTPHYLWMWEDCIEPAQMEAHMKGRAQQVQLAAENGFEFSYFRFVQAFNVLTWAAFDKFELLDSFVEMMAEYDQKTGGKNKKLDDQCAKYVRSTSSSLAVYRPDLSYYPEKPLFTPDYSKPFFVVTVAYHVKPDKFDRAVEIAQRIKELYEKSQAPVGYRAYEKLCGSDLPTFFAVIYAKDKAQLVENEEKNQEQDPISAQIERLFNANLDVLSGIDTVERQYVPEMSYMPR